MQSTRMMHSRVRCLIATAALAHAACASVAPGGVTFYDNEAAWAAAVGGWPVSPFSFSPTTLLLANEVTVPPSNGDDLGSQTLTFERGNTGLPSDFLLTSLNSPNTWHYNFNGPYDGRNQIGPGDANAPVDDWSIHLGPGAPIYGFSLWLLDSSINLDERFDVYGRGGLIGSFPTPTPTGPPYSQFIGFIADEPIVAIEFISDIQGDDIFIADLQFAVPAPGVLALLGLAGLTRDRRRSA